MGDKVWQRCPRCESRRVIIEGREEYGMGRFLRLLMEGTGFLVFMFTFLFIVLILTFITNSTDFSLVVGLISAIGVTVYFVKRFKRASSGRVDHTLFCKDCELRFNK